MTVSDYFGHDFSSARPMFRSAAVDSGAELFSYENPQAKGPNAESLFVDVAVLGSQEAKGALLTISGIHGVEGLGGSGCQVGMMREKVFEMAPPGTRIIAVHALNPFGFAWLRRVNENNVDLNRNFRDFSMPLPANPAYDELHAAIVPAQWEGPQKEQADRSLQGFLQKHGPAAYQAAIQKGQYSRPNGLFFGGTEPVWSNVIFHQILAAHLPPSIERLVVLDYHTGLGPQGYGEPIFVPTDNSTDDTINEAKRLFGAELTVSGDNNSVTAKVSGSVPMALSTIPNSPRCFYIALEFGTLPLPAVFNALRAEQWFINHGNPDDATTAAKIMRQTRDAFFVDQPGWKAAVFGRSADFTLRAFRALA